MGIESFLIGLCLIGGLAVATRPAPITDTVSNARQNVVPRGRLDSIDVLRGLVMVIMAIDHTRDFFTNPGFEPTNLTRTTTAYFFTRWITHFCAPVFVFLAGTGAFLSGARGKPKKELSWFLLTRGLWLIFLELTVLRFGLFFDIDYHVSILLVIWVIGVSMIVLAGLVFLPTKMITGFGLVIIVFHNILDRFSPEQFGSFRWLWALLHGSVGSVPPNPPTALELHSGYILLVRYPLIPWIGVLAAGYGFGQLYKLDQERRRKVLRWLGLGLILGFVVLRASNLYGDPHLWTAQKNGWFTFLSFLNCEKYPPSLLYLMMTLGPAILLLSYLERDLGALARPFVIFGRVPLFYYLIHIPLLHLLAGVFAVIKYGPSILDTKADPTTGPPPGWGFSLPVMYLIWLGVIVFLYPLCRWFANFKMHRRDAWLSYF